MKLIVGLGNPGLKYKGTRHNIGFEVIANLARRYDVGRPKAKFNAEVAETMIGTEKAVLLSPLTFMNLSGRSVKAAIDFYKLPLVDVLVVCDDLALETGRIRLKPGGSAGGQKGLKDIISRLGSQTFARLRIGIGAPPTGWDAADYVLGKFNDQEQPEILNSIQRATQAIESWVTDGIEKSMSQFNADPNKPRKSDSRLVKPDQNKTTEDRSGRSDQGRVLPNQRPAGLKTESDKIISKENEKGSRSG